MTPILKLQINESDRKYTVGHIVSGIILLDSEALKNGTFAPGKYCTYKVIAQLTCCVLLSEKGAKHSCDDYYWCKIIAGTEDKLATSRGRYQEVPFELLLDDNLVFCLPTTPLLVNTTGNARCEIKWFISSYIEVSHADSSLQVLSHSYCQREIRIYPLSPQSVYKEAAEWRPKVLLFPSKHYTMTLEGLPFKLPARPQTAMVRLSFRGRDIPRVEFVISLRTELIIVRDGRETKLSHTERITDSRTQRHGRCGLYDSLNIATANRGFPSNFRLRNVRLQHKLLISVYHDRRGENHTLDVNIMSPSCELCTCTCLNHQIIAEVRAVSPYDTT